MKLNKYFLLSNLFAFCFFTFSHAQNIISGTITSVIGLPIENVVVSLSGSLEETVLSDENGYYEFSVQPGGNYVIKPCYDAGPINGVSNFDKQLISNHIDGQQELETPYKVIAADINNDNSIDSIDTNVIDELILGSIVDFPNNKSWRFIDKSFNFLDPLSPLSTVFPEEGIVNDLGNDIIIDFFGVKIGDVNLNSNISLVAISDGCSSGLVNNDDIFDRQFDVKVFPNPFENKFTISLDKEYSQISLEVYSSAGLQCVNKNYFNTDSITLELSNGQSGVYFVKLISSDITKWISIVKT